MSGHIDCFTSCLGKAIYSSTGYWFEFAGNMLLVVFLVAMDEGLMILSGSKGKTCR